VLGTLLSQCKPPAASAPEQHFTKGNDYLFKEDFVNAKKEYAKAINADTTYWKAYFEYGLVCAMQGDLKTALYYYTHTIDLHPGFATVYYDRANIEELLGDERGYNRDIKKALEIKRDLFNAILAKCHQEYGMGNYKACIADLDSLIAVRDDYFMAYSLRGTCEYKTGDFEGAVADFTHELKLNPGSLTALMNRGVALGEEKNYRAAIADMNTVIAIDPKVSQAFLFKGLYQFKINVKDSACLNFAIAQKMKNPQAEAYIKQYCGK